MSKNKNFFNNKYLKMTLLLICGAVGIFLILGGELFSSSEKKGDDLQHCDEFPDAQAYSKEVEEKVIKLCSQVRGAGKVCAVVTLSGGYNAVYAQNSQSSGSGYKNEFVMLGRGSDEKPLLIGYSPPGIAGIGIICSGGKEEYVRYEMISLVSAAFGISPNKIYVACGQN